MERVRERERERERETDRQSQRERERERERERDRQRREKEKGRQNPKHHTWKTTCRIQKDAFVPVNSLITKEQAHIFTVTG